jgi:hypothetical protein
MATHIPIYWHKNRHGKERAHGEQFEGHFVKVEQNCCIETNDLQDCKLGCPNGG